jgi:short-subunit dehydrogenase
MLLENKNAVIYGATGAVGAAVASAFAREGARVFLTGRNPYDLNRIAEEIRAVGGAAETAEVDALSNCQHLWIKIFYAASFVVVSSSGRSTSLPFSNRAPARTSATS